MEQARRLNQQAQSIPSRDPNDPNFPRLWYVRYADDFLLGVVGSKSEALDIKQKIATFLRDELKLELSDEKTLVTHARDEAANFLGYEIHILHADDKHDHRGQRCINGSVGLRIPKSVITDHCVKYMRSGKPIHLTQRVNDDAYSIVSQYQAEYPWNSPVLSHGLQPPHAFSAETSYGAFPCKNFGSYVQNYLSENLQTVSHNHCYKRWYLQGTTDNSGT